MGRAAPVVLALVASLQSAATGAAAQSPPPPLQRAAALLRGEDPGAAVRLLDSLVAAEPDNAAARYALGVAHAARGEVGEAFRRLEEAAATGRVDLTRLAGDPNAAALRHDPRYRALFPSEADLADPFVESVGILREWVGEEPGGQFGWIARSAGDADGDGLADVVTSAPTLGLGAGRVYLFSSGSGALLWSHTGEPGDQLGLGVEAAGDVNADGTPDVVAGAPGGGYALVLSGTDGTVLHRFEGQANESYGRLVSDVGDLDSDGHADVLVGAPGNDDAGQDAGLARVHSGRDGAVLLEIGGEAAGDRFGASGHGLASPAPGLIVIGAPGAGPADRGRAYVYRGLSPEPWFVVDAGETGLRLGGMFTSIVGDVDGDGVPDVYASDWPDAARGPSTGRVYVRSGRDGEPLHELLGEAAGDGFGIGSADAGDLDGDGRDDLVVGAWQHASAAPGGGKVYLHSGRDGRLLGRVTGKVAGETLGFDATGIGDVDGDGTPDLLVTSAWSSLGGGRNGRMYILSGRDVLATGR